MKMEVSYGDGVFGHIVVDNVSISDDCEIGFNPGRVGRGVLLS